MNIIRELPDTTPLGGAFDHLRLILGVVLGVLAVAYLLWKLPRPSGEETGRDDLDQSEG